MKTHRIRYNGKERLCKIITGTNRKDDGREKKTCETRCGIDDVYGATSYYMSMFQDGNKIIGQDVNGGKFSISASRYGEGEYSAYFSCTNSNGTVDTKWIDFSVVGAAGYSDVRVSKSQYNVSDTVKISVDTVCAKGQVIGIDKEGVGRVVTEQCDPTYSISAQKLGTGSFSAYFSVYNGSGGVDTKRVYFKILA